MAWMSQFDEQSLIIRLVGAMIPSSVCVLSMALLFLTSAGAVSHDKTLSVLSWVASVVLGLVFVVSFIVLIRSLFGRPPKFLSPASRK